MEDQRPQRRVRVADIIGAARREALLRKERGILRTAITAFVSAVLGGVITAAAIFAGVLGFGEVSGDVTIREVPGGGNIETRFGQGLSVQEIYEEAGPGVVSVDVASGELGPGGGSGFVLDEEGHVVTNQHVVAGAGEVSVRFANGVRRQAEVVGEDPSTDIALLKVDAPGSMLHPLALGDSESVEVGDPVVAIGNPLNVGLSVTTGIVSGLDRPIKAPNNYTIDGAIQTDAAISSGNSGGPLLDARGAVIGVNSQVASAGAQGVAQGVGFAVPSNTVKNVVKQLITEGEVEHGYIGVRMFTLGVDEVAAYTGLSKEELGERYDLPPNGAIVSEVVRGGPAYRAGIRGGPEKEIRGIPVPMGDVITEVEGEKVVSPDDVIEVVNSRRPGETMRLEVVTPGEDPRRVRLEVAPQPDEV